MQALENFFKQVYKDLQDNRELKYLNRTLTFTINYCCFTGIFIILQIFLKFPFLKNLVDYFKFFNQIFGIFLIIFIVAEICRVITNNNKLSLIKKQESYLKILFLDIMFGKDIIINFIFFSFFVILSNLKNSNNLPYFINKEIFIMIQGSIISFLVSINFTDSYNLFNRKEKWNEIFLTFFDLYIQIITDIKFILNPDRFYCSSKNINYLNTFYNNNKDFIKKFILDLNLSYIQDFFKEYINCLELIKKDNTKEIDLDKLNTFGEKMVLKKESIEYLLKMISFSYSDNELYIDLFKLYKSIITIETTFINNKFPASKYYKDENINILINDEIYLLNVLANLKF